MFTKNRGKSLKIKHANGMCSEKNNFESNLTVCDIKEFQILVATLYTMKNFLTTKNFFQVFILRLAYEVQIKTKL